MAFYDCLASLTGCSRQISIAFRAGEREDVMQLEVGKDMEVATLRSMIEGETNIPANRQLIYYGNKVLNDNTQTLESVGVSNQDMLQVHEYISEAQAQAARVLSSQQAGTRPRDDAETLRSSALRDPSIMQQLQQHRPELAAAVQSPQRFGEVWNGLLRRQNEAESQKERNMQHLNNGPIEQDIQKKVEEMIREHQVMDNLQDAIEFMPEGKVSVQCNVHPSRNRALTVLLQLLFASTCSMSLLR